MGGGIVFWVMCQFGVMVVLLGRVDWGLVVIVVGGLEICTHTPSYTRC